MTAYFHRLDDLLRGHSAITQSGRVPRAALWLAAQVLVFGVAYGTAMGTFGGVLGERFWQVAYSAAKVPLLLLVTFCIGLPSFFVLNTLYGLRDDFGEAVRALLAAQAGMTLILASLAPFTMLWYASSADYVGATLFNGVMFAVATFSAQWLLRAFYRPLVQRQPRHRWLLRAWLAIYAFVAVQMAWVLRPFIGDPSQPVQFFRDDAWGNAYVVVANLIWETVRRW
ncbi:MAG: hypothetical protein HY290_29900 [Planctomycetia bacterium]|nr:hypothetical protein [Planctomycetia bacterium]